MADDTRLKQMELQIEQVSITVVDVQGKMATVDEVVERRIEQALDHKLGQSNGKREGKGCQPNAGSKRSSLRPNSGGLGSS